MDAQRKILAETIMDMDPLKDPYMNPKQHIGLSPFFLEVRHNLYIYREIVQRRRTEELRKLFAEDQERDNADLRIVGRAIIFKQI